MRFAFILSGILSAGVALSSIPVYEGYPDCHPDDPSAGTTPFGRVPTLQRSAAPNVRKVMPSRVATTRLRLPQ